LIPLILGWVSSPLIPPHLRRNTFGALAGGAGGVAKAVQDKQANTAAQAETERHNREVEAQLKGWGVYISDARLALSDV